MTPLDQTLAHLRAYVEAAAALRAFVLTTGTSPTPNAFFMAECHPNTKPAFAYNHLQPTFTSHERLRMRPFLLTTRAAWASFVQHARSCSPTFAEHTVICIQRLWHDNIDDTTPFHDQPVRLIIGEHHATVPTVDACIDHIRGVLETDTCLAPEG